MFTAKHWLSKNVSLTTVFQISVFSSQMIAACKTAYPKKVESYIFQISFLDVKLQGLNDLNKIMSALHREILKEFTIS